MRECVSHFISHLSFSQRLDRLCHYNTRSTAWVDDTFLPRLEDDKLSYSEESSRAQGRQLEVLQEVREKELKDVSELKGETGSNAAMLHAQVYSIIWCDSHTHIPLSLTQHEMLPRTVTKGFEQCPTATATATPSSPAPGSAKKSSNGKKKQQQQQQQESARSDEEPVPRVSTSSSSTFERQTVPRQVLPHKK